MLKVISRMILYYLEDVVMVSLGDVFLRMSFEVSFGIVMDQLWGHFSVERTTSKVLQSGFYWPTLFKDARGFIKKCDKKGRKYFKEMPLNSILEVDIFYVWGIDFIGSFPSSF